MVIGDDISEGDDDGSRIAFSGKPRSESTVAHRRKIKLNQASGVSGRSPDGWECLSERARSDIPTSCPENSRRFSVFERRRPTNETKCSLYECALREFRLPVCRSRGTAVARKRQNDLLSGCQNCALTWRAARRKNCRHCASVPVTQTRRNRDRMWECRTAHARSDIPHLVRGLRPDTPPTPHGTRKIPRTAHRS